MKFDIKCYEHLTNKGNGKKCTAGPKINGKLPDCPWKKNGIKENDSIEKKKNYINSLAIRCKSWCERCEKNGKKNKTNHFFKEIEPQLEKIYKVLNV